jgi:hypothetical protein
MTHSCLRRQPLILATVVAVAAVAASCVQDASGPGSNRSGYFAVVPRFAAANADIVEIAQLRVILTRKDDETVALDTIIAAPADADSIDLALTVPIVSDSDIFVMTVDFITPSGDVAFSGGPVDVSPADDETAPPVPVEIEIEYVGVGAEAAALEILTQGAWVRLGETVTLDATALDADNEPIEGTPIAWSSLDPSHASVPDPTVGEVLAESEPGSARIVATLLTGQADTADVFVISPGTGRVLIVSNNHFENDTIMKEFALRMPGVEFDTMEVVVQTPTLAFLSTFQAVWLFEDGLIRDQATAVGNVIYDYVQAGGNVVIGTFYWQDRSDNLSFGQPGWGSLEMIDPFLGPQGSEYNPDDLDPASIVPHPLTLGVSSLSVDLYHGGVEANEGTAVVASWSDGVPLIGYRTEPAGQRLVAVSTFPGYPWYCCDRFSGDFYLIWENAISWALGGTEPVAATMAEQQQQVQRAVPARSMVTPRAAGGARRP